MVAYNVKSFDSSFYLIWRTLMSIDLAQMPKLGFGLMRLPQLDGKIDYQHLCKMVDAYMNAGMNYFDTAYVYHSGQSECAVKEVLTKRYAREKFMVATKLPGWALSSKQDIDRIFNEQIERTGLDYFDFYLLHSLEDGDNYEKHEKFGSFEWGLQKKKEGKIKHFGFSFHSGPELLEKILDKHPEMEFVQIQLNYADWDNQIVQSGKLYNILEKRKIPIIVMEPVKGGTLANLPPDLDAKLKAVHPDKSAASWALRFVASLPGIMTILSGMSTQEQMDDNIATFKNFEPLNDTEKKTIEEVVKIMTDLPLIPCTSCRYCTDGCPMDIKIPDIFRALNTKRTYPNDDRPHFFYNRLTANTGKAKDCVACKQCESVCPQHLPIVSLIKEAAQKFDGAA